MLINPGNTNGITTLFKRFKKFQKIIYVVGLLGVWLVVVSGNYQNKPEVKLAET